MSKVKEIKTTGDLRRMLIETIADVRSGKIDPRQARTVAALSTTVLQSAKLDLDYMRFAEEIGISESKKPLALVG